MNNINKKLSLVLLNINFIKKTIVFNNFLILLKNIIDILYLSKK